MRSGEISHIVEVVPTYRARASYRDQARLLLFFGDRALLVIEAFRVRPAPLHIVKVIGTYETPEEANAVARSAAMTYGATVLEFVVHDPATCSHEDCRWARKSQRERDDLEAFGRDADRIDATAGRYW